MSAATPASPVERFLGGEAASGGPFGLLGISPGVCTDDLVVAALERQLDRVGQHPEGDTPEADEVRLALHAAAAQLLDRHVRRHLLERLGQAADEDRAGIGEAETGDAAGVPHDDLERDALRTLAQFGGWNSRSLARLAALASARGLSSHDVAATLRRLATKRRRPTPGAAPRAGAPSRRPAPTGAILQAERTAAIDRVLGIDEDSDDEDGDPAARLLRNVLLVTGGVVVALIGLLVLGIVLLSGGGPGPSGEGAKGGDGAGAPIADGAGSVPSKAQGRDRTPGGGNAAAKGKSAGRDAGAAPVDATGSVRFADPQALVRALRDSVARVSKEPEEAASQFEVAVAYLSRAWTRLDASQRRAAASAVLDFVYASAAWPEASGRAIEALRTGSRAMARAGGPIAEDDVRPAAWSIGMLTKLSQERELKTDISAGVEGALAEALGDARPRLDPSFESGAMAAVRRMPARFVPARARDVPGGRPSGGGDDAGAVKVLGAWVDVVSALAGADADLRERMLVDGLEQVLVLGPDPQADRAEFGLIGSLVSQIKWRKGGPARPRLLDWFRDQRISNGHLQVLTSVLATKSSAEGVDATMVLSTGATANDRARLRETYSRAWGLAEAAGRDQTARDWLGAVRRELDRSRSETGTVQPVEELAQALVLANLNEAATRLWHGESEPAADLVKNASRDAQNARLTPPGRPLGLSGLAGGGDGAWAVSYRAAGRNIPVRVQRLTDLDTSRSTIGVVDAKVLAEAACFESPVEVKGAAQRLIMKLGDEPAVVNALLEVAPLAPRVASVSAMVERVGRRRMPRVTDPEWPLVVRRALVERLLTMVSTSGEQAAIDALARLLGESYRRRAGVTAPSDEQPARVRDVGAAALEGSGALWSAWRSEALAIGPNEYSPLGLDQIERRRQGRLRLADGPVQSLAADQVGVAELMAYVVTSEHPSRAPRAKEILNAMAERRRKSAHIFSQLKATEEAMLDLWVQRYTEGVK